MLKKIIFLVVVLAFVSSAYANLNLTKEVYGPNETFQGYLIVDDEFTDLDEEIKGRVRDCGSSDWQTVRLYDLLSNSSVYSGNYYDYEKVGSGVDFLNINFDVNEHEYGFYLKPDEAIRYFNFTIVGDATPKLDIGMDGYDWAFFGSLSGWGDLMHSEDYDDYSSNYDTGNTANPRQDDVCSKFVFDVEELQDELTVKVNGVAKRVSTGGELKAKSGTKDCVFGEVLEDWTEVNCNLTINVEADNNGTILREICIESRDDSGNAFRIPFIAEDPEYYFISANPGVYSGIASGEFSSNSLKGKVWDYMGSNCNGWCVVPFKIFGSLGSTLFFDPTVYLGSGGVRENVYEVTTKINEYNISNVTLDLNYFYDLTTPGSNYSNCKLEIEFLDEDYSEYFNVSNAPGAVIEVSSSVTAKGIPITFDGSKSSGGVSYSWDFGDNTTGSARTLSHSFLEEGDYNVVLTVKNSKGIESTDDVDISVINLEEALDGEFTSVYDSVEENLSFSGVLDDFFTKMGFGVSKSEVDVLKNEFDIVKASSDLDKDSQYVLIYNKLIGLKSNIIENLYLGNVSVYRNYKAGSILDVPTFSKISTFNAQSLREFKEEVYLYNEDIDSEYNYTSINVDYLEGSEDYVYVVKSFSSGSGELVEKLLGNVRMFSLGCSYDNLTSIIYCINAPYQLEYVVEGVSLDVSSSFIVPTSAYAGKEIIYDFNCESGSCSYKYCGDGKCFIDLGIGVDEKDSSNSNYCPQDCGEKIPWVWYIVLGVVLIFGILWINFYRGPGNFFDVTNKISFSLFKKKLFMVEKDKIQVETFIMRAFREGFNEGEIRRALQKKGWSVKQLNFVFEEIKRKSI
jgi:hypothetical protein